MKHQARELVLHFGLAKTGSSAIQRALFENRAALLRQHGLLYPGDEENHYFLEASFADAPEQHVRLRMRGIHDRGAAQAFLQGYRERLVEQVQATRPRRILISSEYFTAMTEDGLRSLHRFLQPLARRITLFAYVRDPWSHAVSTIQEFVRSGQVADRVAIGYVRSNVEILHKFEVAFGQRVQVAAFGAAGRPFNVVADFCHRFGIAPELVDAARYVGVNAGMQRDSAIALLQVNASHPTYDAEGRYIHDAPRDWMIEALLRPVENSRPIRLSAATADRIRDDSREDLALLQYRYLGGDPVLSDAYGRLRLSEETDVLEPESQSPRAIYDQTLLALRSLAERAFGEFVERIFWTGKFYRASAQPEAARTCFTQLVEMPAPHRRRDDAAAELAALTAQEQAHRPAPG